MRACWDCRHICQETLFRHSLIIGGPHLDEQNVRLMVDSIQACQLAADYMTRGSAMSEAALGFCAGICEACAISCERIGDEAMMRCAEACSACADACRHDEGARSAA